MAVPDLTVVIPARDEAARLGDTLRGVQRAAARAGDSVSIEIVVADHDSRDGTAGLARSFGALVVDAREATTIAAVRNAGARVARGRILAFLDADCVPGPGWLAAALRVFEDPAVGGAGLPPRAPEGGSWTARASGIVALPRRLAPDERQEARWLPSANLLVRRDVFEAVGGFDASLVTCEDYDLTLRVRAHGWRLVRDGGLEALHRREPEGVRALFRKERWRGLASLEGARRHGLTWGEAPSLLLPLWHALGALGVAVCLGRGDLPAALALLALLALPSLVLAARTALRARSASELGPLVGFFLVYNAARTAALVRKGA